MSELGTSLFVKRTRSRGTSMHLPGLIAVSEGKQSDLDARFMCGDSRLRYGDLRYPGRPERTCPAPNQYLRDAGHRLAGTGSTPGNLVPTLRYRPGPNGLPPQEGGARRLTNWS